MLLLLMLMLLQQQQQRKRYRRAAGVAPRRFHGLAIRDPGGSYGRANGLAKDASTPNSTARETRAAILPALPPGPNARSLIVASDRRDVPPGGSGGGPRIAAGASGRIGRCEGSFTGGSVVASRAETVPARRRPPPRACYYLYYCWLVTCNSGLYPAMASLLMARPRENKHPCIRLTERSDSDRFLPGVSIMVARPTPSPCLHLPYALRSASRRACRAVIARLVFVTIESKEARNRPEGPKLTR